MFCPDCGAENVKSQKFCVRCGSNLLALDRAREIIGEVAGNTIQSEGPSPHLLRMIALISIFGFICVTSGSVFLMLIDPGNGPMPFFFGAAGFTSLVLICRYLLRASGPVRRIPTIERPVLTSPVATPLSRSATNRGLGGGSVPVHSVIEDSTKQFENER